MRFICMVGGEAALTCTFFGHRDTPETVRPLLCRVLTQLIETRGADTFYVGHQGDFDRMVRQELKKLQARYPQIRVTVMLAYLPEMQKPIGDGIETVYPDGLETVPPRFAIEKRNRILLDRADLVVTYVRYPFGGAAKFKALAVRKGKEVIELNDL